MAKNSTKQEQESAKILKRVEQESEVLGSSSFSRVANKVTDHVAANDVDQNDKIEVLGTRIGRVLSAIFFAFLVIYLFTTYVIK